MAISTTTITTQTFTGEQGNWSSSVFNAGTYTELILDAVFTSLTDNAIIELNRIDPLNNSVTIWSAARNSETNDLLAIDIGPCDGYEVSHAFGDQIQVVITTTGTYSGSLCLQGKG